MLRAIALALRGPALRSYAAPRLHAGALRASFGNQSRPLQNENTDHSANKKRENRRSECGSRGIVKVTPQEVVLVKRLVVAHVEVLTRMLDFMNVVFSNEYRLEDLFRRRPRLIPLEEIGAGRFRQACGQFLGSTGGYRFHGCQEV